MALAVGYPGWIHVVGCRLNIYTIPYVIFAAAVVGCIILTQLFFKPKTDETVRTGQGMELGQVEKDEEHNGKQKVVISSHTHMKSTISLPCCSDYCNRYGCTTVV